MQDTNTLFIGKVLFQFQELKSTNDYCKELLSKAEPAEGTTVQADYQSAGHGQIGSKWISNPGENLLLSLILFPRQLAVKQQFVLTQMTALAVRDLIYHYLPQASIKIKWPNDIFLNGRKTAGILLQITIRKNGIKDCIIGIGLNLNQVEFPIDLQQVTSLALESGQEFQIDQWRNQLFKNLEIRYLQLKNGHMEKFSQEYLEHLYLKDEPAPFKTATAAPFTGIIRSVTEEGKLLVETDAGLQMFGFKEIQYL